MNSPRVVPRIPYRTMARSTSATGSLWSSTVNSPFSATPVRIPDTDTNVSGLVTTRYYTTFKPTAIATTASLHTGGFLIAPHPNFLYTAVQETAGGGLSMTDLNAAGSDAYIQVAAPNASSISGQNMARVRCVSIGVRVTYEGTELNRAGRIVAGMFPNELPASSLSASGTKLSLLSTMAGTVPVSYDLIKQSLQNLHVSRTTDSSVEVSWRPFGVPGYNGMDNTGSYLLTSNTTAGAAVQDSLYACGLGSNGLNYGSGILAIFIENDNVSSAALFGNNYGVEVIAHWEVIPKNPYLVAYDLAPSPSDSLKLSTSMNAISFRPTVLTARTTSGNPSDRPAKKSRKGPSVSTKSQRTTLVSPPSLPAIVAKGGKESSAMAAAFLGTYLPAVLSGMKISNAMSRSRAKQIKMA